jgi:hypothetical protein
VLTSTFVSTTQHYLLHNSSTYLYSSFLSRKKKEKRFSYFRWRGVIQQQPMNGSVMIQTS